MSDSLPDPDAMTQADLDREILKFRTVDPKSLTEDELRRVVSLHAAARRRTSGPPKPKAAKKTPATLDDLGLGL